ncbi:MAG: hypothetical protein ACQPRH_00260 [Solitalea-like symbiont of Tyrophagus putrescentiae]
MKILKPFIIALFLILLSVAICILNVITIKQFAYYTHDKTATEVLFKGIFVYILQPFSAFSLLFVGIKTITKKTQLNKTS